MVPSSNILISIWMAHLMQSIRGPGQYMIIDSSLILLTNQFWHYFGGTETDSKLSDMAKNIALLLSYDYRVKVRA